MMKHALARYDAYKNSGIEWLNEIPQHWHMERVKNITKTQSGTTPQSDTSEYYENGTNFWVRTTDLNNDRLYSSEYQITDFALNHCGLKSIPVNSVLLAMYGGMGTIGKNSLLKEKVTINQSVCAILPHIKRFDSTYFWYYVQYFRPHWEMYADSARKDPNINQEAVKRLWVTIPPLSEQHAIADYLDTKIYQIDRKIDLLTQKTTQYGKLKQSLINETVTRGLDKTVAMKDSGVEWVGEVPEHWGVKRLKEIFVESKAKSTTGDETLLSVSEYTGVTQKQDNIGEDEFVSRAESLVGYKICKVGDLVINIMLAWKRGLGVSSFYGIVSPSYAVYDPLKEVSSSFFHYLLRTEDSVVS
jgi:type I restriction enzyme, S subunit